MYTALSPGALGMSVGSLKEGIALAASAGYGGLEISIHEAQTLIASEGAATVRAWFDDAGVKPAAWGLPVAWSGPEEEWKQGVETLKGYAAAAEALGCDRTMTWILSGSNDRTFEQNLAFHIERFTPIAAVLNDHGVRLGLEFLGPQTIYKSFTHRFVHTMAGMLEMGDQIGPNVGLLLDCWHWYTAGGTLEELAKLDQRRVVYVHVNDAPVGVALEDHIDNQRGLPGATGVIDLPGFLRALEAIGYDGPVTPEPFGNPATWAADALRGVWAKAGL